MTSGEGIGSLGAAVVKERGEVGYLEARAKNEMSGKRDFTSKIFWKGAVGLSDFGPWDSFTKRQRGVRGVRL
jgi:hypothetical protein